jgi:hypothetical protein
LFGELDHRVPECNTHQFGKRVVVNTPQIKYLSKVEQNTAPDSEMQSQGRKSQWDDKCCHAINSEAGSDKAIPFEITIRSLDIHMP